jgi:hypothetical protein
MKDGAIDFARFRSEWSKADAYKGVLIQKEKSAAIDKIIQKYEKYTPSKDISKIGEGLVERSGGVAVKARTSVLGGISDPQHLPELRELKFIEEFAGVPKGKRASSELEKIYAGKKLALSETTGKAPLLPTSPSGLAGIAGRGSFILGAAGAAFAAGGGTSNYTVGLTMALAGSVGALMATSPRAAIAYYQAAKRMSKDPRFPKLHEIANIASRASARESFFDTMIDQAKDTGSNEEAARELWVELGVKDRGIPYAQFKSRYDAIANSKISKTSLSDILSSVPSEGESRDIRRLRARLHEIAP